MRALPYLNGLRTFEAAARLGSFAGAARELNVTPAAVSRMVKLLEQRTGVDLFERTANRLTLTAAGRVYHSGLTPILDALAELAERVRQQAGPSILTVGVGPTFAIRWLIPRLADFRDVAPDIDVRITTGGIAAPFADDWTCGIKLGDGRYANLVSQPLFSADLVPVCAPRLAQRLTSPRQLRGTMLLRVTHSEEDWQLWLAAAKVKAITASGPSFAYYNQALQAAADGVGIALGLRPYIDDDVAAGRLVAPFPLTVAKGSGWYLMFRPSRIGEPAFEAFRNWIVRKAGEKVADKTGAVTVNARAGSGRRPSVASRGGRRGNRERQ